MTKEEIQALMSAISSNNIAYIKTLAETNIDWIMSPFNKDKSLVIHSAAYYGRLEIVQFLIEKNRDLLNITDIFGQSPLLLAARFGYEDIVEYLAELGADLTLESHRLGEAAQGKSPIRWATERGHHQVVECLMNHGVDVERQFGSSQKHLVHIAAKNGHIKIVKLLLAKNSDWLNLQDTVGQTPLLWAAGVGM